MAGDNCFLHGLHLREFIGTALGLFLLLTCIACILPHWEAAVCTGFPLLTVSSPFG